MRAGLAMLVALGTLFPATPTLAQSLVIQPSDDLRPLARRTVTALVRRGVDASLGEPAPEIPEAIGRGRVALVERDGAIWVGIGGQDGHTLSDSLALDARDLGAPQAVALMIESLLDEPPPPTALDAPRPSGSQWTYVEYPREEPERQGAMPSIYLRLLAGYSPTRSSVLIGPGAGLGLCVGAHCVVIEADLPLVPEKIQIWTGETLRYRAVNTSIRAQIRPWARERWSFGFTFGLLSRIGTVSVVGGDHRQTATNLGFRTSLEMAWRIGGPFEWVFEAGVDAVHSSSQARAFVHGQTVFLEDTWTPWLTTSLRLRPQVE